MRNSMKKAAAIMAAVTMLSVCPMSAEALFLRTQDGLKYVQYDSGESELYSGWTKKAGERYYYKNGVMKKNCWLKLNGKRTYFLKKDGAMAVGKATISGVEYEFDENGRIVEDTLGVTVSLEDVSSTGAEITISKSSEIGTDKNHLITGIGFSIEKLDGGKWEPVEPIVDELCWTEEGYDISSESVTKMEQNWENIYGELGKGRYRICKPISYMSYGVRGSAICYAYFDID